MYKTLFLLFIAIVPVRGFATTILVIGDSISAGYGLKTGGGWVTLLEQKLSAAAPAYRVVNASISGDTSAGGLARIDRELARHRPAIVILELGGNDGLRGLTPKAMKANLRTMIERARAQGAKVLLLGMRIPPNYGKRYTELFYQVYRQLAAETEVAFVPFLLDGVGGHQDLMQHDGIHPNAKAQPLLLDAVWEQLQNLL